MKVKYFSAVFFLWISFTACQSQQGGTTLEAGAFNEKIKSFQGATILDVRTPEEFSGGFIDGAHNIDYKNKKFFSRIDDLNKDRTYFVYCLSGGRSGEAARYMRSHGFKEVYDLKGGLLSWRKNNLPLTSGEKAPADKISPEAYQSLIAKGNVLVDFYAPWCGPCKKMEPMLNELKKDYAQTMRVLRINIDENKRLTKEMGIEEIPLLKLYKEGREVWTHKGLTEKQQIVEVLQ